MKKPILKHKVVSILLAEGATTNEAEVPKVPGTVVGLSTVGEAPSGKTADVVLLDGGNEVSDPLDITITSHAGKSLRESIVPLNRPNPGQLVARINMSAAVGSGEDFSVKVNVWYVPNVNDTDITITDCF